MKTFVEIHIPGSSTQRHELRGARTSIGSGPQASIRIPATSGLQADQLEIFIDEQGPRIQVPISSKGGLVYEGKEQRRVRLPWGGEIYLGKMRLTFIRVAADMGTRPLLLALAPALLLLLCLVAYRRTVTEAVSDQDVPAPGLFEVEAREACVHSDPMIAAARAREHERAAWAKQERFAFNAAEGIAAASLFRSAAACFSAAGYTDDASRATGELVRWAGKLDEQYATLRLRLRVALDDERPADALRAVLELQALLAHHQEGPYQQWLAQTARTLERRTAKPGS